MDKLPRIRKLDPTLRAEQVATFFFIVTPGLEDAAWAEVSGAFQVTAAAPGVFRLHGGIQLDATWQQVATLQPQLRSVSRILVRVDQFGARDFQKLHRKLKGMPWKDWLADGVRLQFRAASEKSRLRVKRAIEETARDAFTEAVGAEKTEAGDESQELLCLIRVESDIATISLDVSGELLHKRGDREDVGKAPLRETYAAAALAIVEEAVRADAELMKTAEEPWQWIEPMAGTAVFLREALGRSPGPAVRRHYALETCFRIEALVLQSMASGDEPGFEAVAGSGSLGAAATDGLLGILNFQSAVVIDNDTEQLARAEQGLRSGAKVQSGRSLPIQFLNSPDEDVAGLSAGTVAEINKAESNLAHRFVILNPPWGRRLKGDFATDTKAKQEALLARLAEQFRPKLIAVLLPVLAAAKNSALTLPRGWRVHSTTPFRVGGQSVALHVFKVI